MLKSPKCHVVRKGVASVTLALFIAASLPAAAQQNITLVGEDDWYPYSAEHRGMVRGLAPELIAAAYKSVNISVNFKVMPYARCMSNVKAGHELGCFNSAPDPTLRADYHFHQVALFDATIGIYAPASATKTGLTVRDLSGTRVGLTNGYTYGDAVEADSTIVRDVARTDLLSLRKLIAGRTEYALVYTRVVDYLQSAHPAELKGKVKYVGLATKSGLFLTFSKARPDAPKYAQLLDQGLKNLHKTREYDRIIQRWATPPL